MTLDGTRTYIIGTRRIAIIDPGPLLDEHLANITAAAGSCDAASVLVTHSHPDHSEGAMALAEMLDTRVESVRDRDIVETDAGALRAIATPGHTPDHISFWWAAERALFCGDLMMGGLDTALVAKPEGDLRDYLASLRVLRDLDPAIIFPAHGDFFTNPIQAIDNYTRHREERVAQVRAALEATRSIDAVLDQVYGSGLDPRLRPYAQAAVDAYVDYIREHA